MYFVYKVGSNRFSLVSVSICGAVAHNLAQLAMAAFVVQTPGVFAYLPLLLLFAVPTGFLTGVISAKLVGHFQKLPIFNQ
jgi:heptaprenyl diphosphate synthase